MEIDYRKIGRKIREKRKEMNLSQESLAKIVDVGSTHISHIETGKCIPSLTVFIKILQALDADADAILTGRILPNESAKNLVRNIQLLLENYTSEELENLAQNIHLVKQFLSEKER